MMGTVLFLVGCKDMYGIACLVLEGITGNKFAGKCRKSNISICEVSYNKQGETSILNHKYRIEKGLRLCTGEYLGPRGSKSKILKIKQN